MDEFENVMERYVTCRKCSAVTVSRWEKTLWGFGKRKWKNAVCSKCHAEMESDQMEEITFRTCPHCGCLTEKNETGRCLKCGESVLNDKDTLCISCPECNTENLFIKTSYDRSKQYVCRGCGEVLPQPDETEQSHLAAEPMLIRLPNPAEMDKTNRFIWQYGKREFPAGSQLIVSDGTWALMLENGACTENRGAGNYLLEELKCGRSGKLAAGLAGESIVFTTDIYCVREKLPEIKFGVNAFAIDDEHFLGMSGAVSCRVFDAKMFALHFNYRDDQLMDALTKDIRTRIDAIAYRNNVYDILKECNTSLLASCKADEVAARIRRDLNNDLERFGIIADEVIFHNLVLDPTRVLKTKEAIYSAAERISWKINTRVFDPKEAKLSVDYEFSGSIRLQVDNMDRLMQETAELRKLVDSARREDAKKTRIEPGEPIVDSRAVQTFFQNLVQDLIGSELISAVKALLSNGISDVASLDSHLQDLNYQMKPRLDSRLHQYGLSISKGSDELITAAACILSKEYLDYTANKELEEHRKKDHQERLDQLFSCISTGINWKVSDTLLHETNDPGMTATVSYVGTCTLTIEDAQRFTELNDIKQMLKSSIDSIAVQAKFQSLIEGILYQVITYVAQRVIDGEKGTIRELDHLNYELCQNVKTDLSGKLRPYGLSVLTLTIAKPNIMPSDALRMKWDSLADQSKLRTGQDLREAHAEDHIHEAKVDSQTHNFAEDIRTDDEIKDIDRERKLEKARLERDLEKLENQSALGEAAATKDARDYELRRQKTNREHQEQLQDIRRTGEIDAEKDRERDNKDERTYQSTLANFRRQARLDEEIIQKRLREDRLWQDGKIEKDRIDQEAVFASEDRQDEHDTKRAVGDQQRKSAVAAIIHSAAIDEAHFKETLNGIMHKIDSSDLDWQEKLAAYNRLQRQLDVQADSDEELLAAKTDAEAGRITADAAAYRRKLAAENAAQIDVITAGAEAETRTLISHAMADEALTIGKAKIEVETMKNTMDYNRDANMLKLSDAEAQLYEKIARYSEDRDQRIARYTSELQQQRDVLMFQQHMEEERLRISSQMELLQMRYAESQKAQELQLELFRSKMELEKLKLEQDCRAAMDRENQITQRTKIQSDEEIQKSVNKRLAETAIAEADALVAKALAQMEEREKDAKRAHELSLKAYDITSALQQANIDLQKHQIDANVNIETVRSKSASAELVGKVEQILQTLNSKDADQKKEDSKKLDQLIQAVGKIGEDAERNAREMNQMKALQDLMAEFRKSNRRTEDKLEYMKRKLQDLNNGHRPAQPAQQVQQTQQAQQTQQSKPNTDTTSSAFLSALDSFLNLIPEQSAVPAQPKAESKYMPNTGNKYL